MCYDRVKMFQIYRPRSENIKFFLEIIGLGIFLRNCKNICIFVDLNSGMINFINIYCLTNFVKNPTCFKSASGTKILILTKK